VAGPEISRIRLRCQRRIEPGRFHRLLIRGPVPLIVVAIAGLAFGRAPLAPTSVTNSAGCWAHPAQTFLFGAELTQVIADSRNSATGEEG
jgi:hypothetical protein